MSIAEQKLDLANKFTEVCNMGMDKFHTGMTVKLFRTCLNVHGKLDPLWMIETGGPFFFKFRNEIIKRDIDFFIDRDYREQREDWIQLTRGYGENIAIAFEDSIRSSLAELKITEPNVLLSMPNTILRIYVKYVQLCQTAAQQ